MVATVVAIFIAGFSSIATGLNFIVTIHRLRAPGMTWYKMPVFLWSLYATSVILVLATPVLAMTLILLAFERIFHVGVFDPALGGDPLLFQHLFWFYSHPAVYVMILPGFGVVSEIIPAFLAQRDLRLQFHCVVQHLDRGDQLPRLGPSHVRGRHVDLLRVGLFDLELPGRGAVRDQGVQLDRHHAQGLHPVRRADAVRARLHRPLHHWRPDRPVPGGARRRRAPDADLFRRRAFPLHHGRRHGVRLLRRAALLVAEDYRADVSGDVGPRLARSSSSSVST